MKASGQRCIRRCSHLFLVWCVGIFFAVSAQAQDYLELLVRDREGQSRQANANDFSAQAGDYAFTRAMLEDVIREQLEEQGVEGEFTFSINGLREENILSHPSPVEAVVTLFKVTESSRRFEMAAEFTAEGEVIARRQFMGRYDESVEVPVLRRRIAADEEIQAEDVELKAYPRSRVRAQTVLDAEALIGKSSRRGISAGRPVLERELKIPTLVHKGDMVSMRYHNGPITITAMGEALDEGGMNQRIRVKNIDSNAVIFAYVSGSKEVKVIPAGAKPPGQPVP